MRSKSKIRLAISYYCELNCQHCYVPQQLRTRYDEIMQNELSVDQIVKFINHLSIFYGLKKVDITGGEALLKKVWDRTKYVVNFALDKGLEVQINTTGSGDISPKRIKDAFQRKSENLLLHVSLDGVDQKYVDSFRGRKGAFIASINFMREAISLGLKVRTRLTMTPNNICQVIPCYKFVSDLGVTSFMCKPVNIAGSSIKNDLNTLHNEALRDIQLELLKQSVNNSTALHLPAPLAITASDIPVNANVEISHCLCGKHLIYIAYNGDIFPCTYMAGMNDSYKYIIGNIREDYSKFEKKWEKDDTYFEFRNTENHICTAHRLSIKNQCL